MTRPLAAVAVFLAAPLLFLVQPIAGRLITPRLGGGAAVWSACLVFFQVALLGGYAWAAFAAARLSWRTQRMVHVGLLAASLIALPLGVAGESVLADLPPAVGILLGLALGIGAPYALLASTSPLVQSWLARSGQPPWRLFALSNAASLAALVAYPFVVEPLVGLKAQTLIWSVAYGGFAIVMAVLAWRIGAAVPAKSMLEGVLAAEKSEPEQHDSGAASMPAWIILSAVPSALLIAVTEHITRDVAPVPLLWIPPLAIYLLTFVLWFDGRLPYMRALWLPAAVLAASGMAYGLTIDGLAFRLKASLAIFGTGLLIVCLFCHGELAGRKPPPDKLGRYYLSMAIGGALGGLCVGLLAPMLLSDLYDLPIVLAACVSPLALAALALPRNWMRLAGLAGALVAFGTGIYAMIERFENQSFGMHSIQRGFYGVLRTSDTGVGTPDHARSLSNGAILHGFQMMAENRRLQATGYYRDESAVGRAVRSLPLGPRRIGVVGLGSGVMAAHGRPGDVIRFYDIDPLVVKVAARDFSFLALSKASIDIVMGDARLSLAKESPQKFDVLAIDAFSGDAIPLHLLTIEAVGIYLNHLTQDGVLAIHVSNKFFDLPPLIERAAERLKLHSVFIRDLDTDGYIVSDWVLLARTAKPLQTPLIAELAKPIAPKPDWPLWTDDRSDILRLLK